MISRLKLKSRLPKVRFCSNVSDKNSNNTEIKIETDSDIKRKESTAKVQELLKKMLSERKINEDEYRQKFATAPDIPSRQKKSAQVERTVEKFEDGLAKAASEVAKSIGGDVKHTEEELLSKVLGKIDRTTTSLSDLISGMKVDRSQQKDENEIVGETRGQMVKRFVARAQAEGQKRKMPRITRDFKHQSNQRLPQVTKIDIWSEQPLGIFQCKSDNYGTRLETWEHLKQRELNLATTQPPANYFQKMIMWTEQGKVWKFPIDNEQGLEEEQNVHFSEHVFLDVHLDGWCPKKGPIRHFMELVCVGLSKNPFYTVKEKKDHIMWYKEYFESKSDLLTEVGAWEVKTLKVEENTKVDQDKKV